jgi:HlyD family secretion protein
MKRGWIVLLILVILAGAAGAGWWWARTSPQQVVDFLVSGGLVEERAQAFVAALGGETGEEETAEVLVASGSIEGVEVAIVSEFGGRITAIYADEGDEVGAGDPLVQLDTSLLEAQLAQARAAVAAAEANLASVQAGSHPAEILAAEAALQQAIAQRGAARTAWEGTQAILDDPQDLEGQIVQARSQVKLAKTQIEGAEAQVAAAEVERDQYRAQGSMQEKYLYQVGEYQVQAAQAALEAARAQKTGAQRNLAALRALRDQPLAILSNLHQAEGQYNLAAAGVGVASAYLDEVKAGPMPEEVAVAEAQVAQAQAAVGALETHMAMMQLASPLAGVVTSRSAQPGEPALAGVTLLTVANLDEVRLTIYVPEDELSFVYLGQEVEVAVDSYPGRTFAGTVSFIAQEAEFTPKNVQTEKERVNMVFAVRVRLPNPDSLLKPGMPADATLRRE